MKSIKEMNLSQRIMLAANVLLIVAIFILNYFYQSNGFSFKLKCTCSGLFAFLGLANLGYAIFVKAKNMRFYAVMAAGLVLAFLGDVFIKYDFIAGAAVFALGHVAFVVAYCFVERLRPLDYILWGAIFAGAAAFLLSPLVTFSVPLYRVVCVVYALIISAMLGKAVGNFVRKKSLVSGTVAFASFLFFFSDLMLVLDWFVGKWEWTDNACMGTYYPALCFLGLSMLLTLVKKEEQ